MSEKSISGNFYRTDDAKKMPEECPNCLYKPKETEQSVEECPRCHYTIKGAGKESK